MSEEPSHRPSSSLRSAQHKVAKRCQYLRAFVSGYCFWIGLPARVVEHFMCVEHFMIWRQHMMWAKHSGEELKNILTQRFASSAVFLSLLLSTEIGVLFSPSDPAKQMREELENADHESLGFYTGLVLCVSIFMTIAAIVSTFTAWSVISTISKENIHSVLRSTIGLYATQLPSNIIIMAIYLFFGWIVLFWYIIMPLTWAIILNTAGALTVAHVVSTYSALGRVIMHTGAMADEDILDGEDHKTKTPGEIYDLLQKKTKLARRANIPVEEQYRTDYQGSLRNLATASAPGAFHTAAFNKNDSERISRTNSIR